MDRRREILRPRWLYVGCAVLMASLVGCGDDREKIIRPENPTSTPDPSMKLHMGSPHDPATNPSDEATKGKK